MSDNVEPSPVTHLPQEAVELPDRCPHCNRQMGQASFSTAPRQRVCANPDCPVNTWDARKA